MQRRRFLKALAPLSVGLIMLTGTVGGESPAPLAPFQFLLGEWKGIGDQAGATGGFTFLSEIKTSEPRYRLMYTRGSATTLNGKFEVAPPGKPEEFAPYLSWASRKVK
jgi:hypothetical protein